MGLQAHGHREIGFSWVPNPTKVREQMRGPQSLAATSMLKRR
jgi:hypothetical protein